MNIALKITLKNLLRNGIILAMSLLIFWMLGGQPVAAQPAIRIAAEDFPGDDVGAKVNAALATMNQQPGVVTVTTSGDINTTIQLGVGQILEFGDGEWNCTAAPGIILDNASQVIGSGVFRTRLILATSSNGPIIQSKDYNQLIGKSEKEVVKGDYRLEGDHKYLPGVKYIKIRGLTLFGDKANHSAPAPANGIEIFGFWYWIEELAIENFPGDGLVTQFITAPGVSGNDSMESYFTNIKFINNARNGWSLKGPHDSIISGIVSANNGEWGIDVMHEEGHYSGGGAMFTNTHLYGNKMGLRTAPGANILAFGLESEANTGVGLLLRSNDSVIHGTFYANGTYGIQIGEESFYAGVNILNVQVHNNSLAQIKWESSGGYNSISGSIFPMDGQKYFELNPTSADQVVTVGPGNLPVNLGAVVNSDQKKIAELEKKLVSIEKNGRIIMGVIIIAVLSLIVYIGIRKYKSRSKTADF